MAAAAKGTDIENPLNTEAASSTGTNPKPMPRLQRSEGPGKNIAIGVLVLLVVGLAVGLIVVANRNVPLDDGHGGDDDHGGGGHIDWSYSGAYDAASWPTHFGDCGQSSQSPINIVRELAGTASQPACPPGEQCATNLYQDYPTTGLADNGALFEARGSHPGWKVVPGPFAEDGSTSLYTGTMTLDNQVHKLAQFHFHSPSEHTINGQSYPLEMHMVHYNEDLDQYAVFGILFSEGVNNSTFLDEFWAKMEHMGSAAPTTINLDLILDNLDSGFWRYDGSFTTPPCTEGVKWVVTEALATQSVSWRQVDEFVNIVKLNARPTQPWYGREVTRYTF